MALPIILAGAGVPAIAGASLWQVGMVAARYTWKTTLYIAFFGLIVLVIGSSVTSVIEWVYALDTPIPDVVGQVFWWFLPENTLSILFTIFSAKIARTAYEFKLDMLNKHLYVYSTK